MIMLDLLETDSAPEDIKEHLSFCPLGYERWKGPTSGLDLGFPWLLEWGMLRGLCGLRFSSQI